jgi:hypothetical protein
MPNIFLKDPNAVLDYVNDWSDWLGTDTIVTSTWTAPTGITVDSNAKTDTSTTVWLSGGTTGITYSVVNRIVTAAGRTEDRTLMFWVMER